MKPEFAPKALGSRRKSLIFLFLSFSRTLSFGAFALLLAACASAPRKDGDAKRGGDEGPLAVAFSPEARKDPVTGRVLLLLSRKETEDIREIDWLDMQPVYGLQVTNLAPGQPAVFSPESFTAPDALAFPGPLHELSGAFWAQALVDVDDSGGFFNHAAGNLYGKTVRIELNNGLAKAGKAGALIANRVMQEETAPADTEWLQFVEFRSELLSRFLGSEVIMRAAVILPAGYREEKERLFPVVYSIPGFSGRHFNASEFLETNGEKWKRGDWPYRAIKVVLDPEVRLGHSVFANSANNGPVGDALVKEFVPEIERRYRAAPRPEARVVQGHSSGGWSSLWLQVTYPDFFGGCWSTSPDPVDFRAFQTMNIYEDRNGHWSRAGQPRGLARDQHRMQVNFATFNHWEYVVGPGFQLDSFNAVFSPRAADGRPMLLMDKLSGEINRDVAGAWRAYDIRHILETNWPKLGPKLKGKIHILCGAWDTFYLNPAVELLRDFLSRTDFAGYVEMMPGNHFDVLTGFSDRINAEIGEYFERAGFKQ